MNKWLLRAKEWMQGLLVWSPDSASYDVFVETYRRSFERERKTGDFSAVKYMACYMFLPLGPFRPAVVDAVAQMMATHSLPELIALDEHMRTYSFAKDGNPWSAWLQAKPSQCDGLFGRHVLVSGLLSSHPNGFIRALAVDDLASWQEGTELPFLLTRATDWVPQVKLLATAAVERRLRIDYACNFISHLAFIEQLKMRRRASEGLLFQKIEKFLTDPDNREQLLIRIEKESVFNRRRRFELATCAFSHNAARVTEVATRDPDQLLRYRVLKFVSTLPGGETDDIVKAYSRDPSAQIRVCALETILSRNLPEADDYLIESLCDKTSSVRQFARYYLKERRVAGICDQFAGYYRAALSEGDAMSPDKLVGAIAGIAEIGEPADVALVFPLLDHKSVTVQKQAIKAVAALDSLNNLSLLSKYLNHDRSGVSRAAADVLAKFTDYLNEADLWKIFEASNLTHTKLNLVRLFNYLRSWERFTLLLKAACAGPPTVTCACEDKLSVWLRQYGSTYAYLRPGKDLAKAILEAIPSLEGKLSPKLIRDLEPVLKFCQIEHDKYTVESEV